MQSLAIYHINHNRQFEFTLHSQEIGIEIFWKLVKLLEENVETTENDTFFLPQLVTGGQEPPK